VLLYHWVWVSLSGLNYVVVMAVAVAGGMQCWNSTLTMFHHSLVVVVVTVVVDCLAIVVVVMVVVVAGSGGGVMLRL